MLCLGQVWLLAEPGKGAGRGCGRQGGAGQSGRCSLAHLCCTSWKKEYHLSSVFLEETLVMYPKGKRSLLCSVTPAEISDPVHGAKQEKSHFSKPFRDIFLIPSAV